MAQIQEVHLMHPDELSLHPEALSTPRMSEVAFEALKRDIEMQGQLEPVIAYRGKICDGRHRWLIIR